MNEPKDYFHGKSVGEIKSGRMFRMWHSKRKRNTGQQVNIPSQKEWMEKKANHGNHKNNFPVHNSGDVTSGISDSEILKQLEEYISPTSDNPNARNAKNFLAKLPTGPLKKGFQQCLKKVRDFIKLRKKAQKSSDWALDKPWATNSNKYEEDYSI
jgi:hypothetical protein